jgi:hypothetical protein
VPFFDFVSCPLGSFKRSSAKRFHPTRKVAGIVDSRISCLSHISMTVLFNLGEDDLPSMRLIITSGMIDSKKSIFPVLDPLVP